jgi:hypothetical protein
MTGITKPNNYYKTRKQLEDKGYIKVDEKGNIYIDTQKIIDEYTTRKEDEEYGL